MGKAGVRGILYQLFPDDRFRYLHYKGRAGLTRTALLILIRLIYRFKSSLISCSSLSWL